MSFVIDGSTKLASVLKHYPDVLPYIISLNPHDFERLNNPLMRRIMPQRITLGRIASMTDTPLEQMVAQIYASAGESFTSADRAMLSLPELAENPQQPPDWLNQPVVFIVDLLAADERLDTDPFVPLFPVINRAAVGDVILIKHRWEPAPLYDVWEKLKIKYYAVQQSPNEWWIYLQKTQVSKQGNR